MMVHNTPSFLLSEDGNMPNFQNVAFSNYLEFCTMDKVHNPSDSDCILINSIFIIKITDLSDVAACSFSRVA
jgi:hypothetical protein